MQEMSNWEPQIRWGPDDNNLYLVCLINWMHDEGLNISGSLKIRKDNGGRVISE